MTPSANIEQDERDNVELPLIAQLVAMGWDHVEGDRWIAAQSERASFDEVVVRDRLRAKLVEINRDEHGQQWLTPDRADEAIAKLVAFRGVTGLLARNRALTEMLLAGVQIAKDPSKGEQRDLACTSLTSTTGRPTISSPSTSSALTGLGRPTGCCRTSSCSSTASRLSSSSARAAIARTRSSRRSTSFGATPTSASQRAGRASRSF